VQSVNWTETLQWPVLQVADPRFVIIPYQSAEELLSATYIALPDLQRMERFFVVDSRRTRVVLAKPRMSGAPPSAVRRLLFRLLNPTVRIEYDQVDIEEDYPLSQVQGLLAENARRHPDYWSEFDISTIEEFIQAIWNAKTMAELLRLAGAEAA
jgi:hypothetical protein